MKTKTVNELKALGNIVNACKKEQEYADEIFSDKDVCTMAIAIEQMQRPFENWFCALSNCMTGMCNAKTVFSNSQDRWEEFQCFIKAPLEVVPYCRIPIPENATLERVVKTARNRVVHPDKINQEELALLIHYVPQKNLLQLSLMMRRILAKELESLSEEEFDLMVAESFELKRRIAQVQISTQMALSELDNSIVFTPQMQKQIDGFMNFIPNAENVRFEHKNKNTEKKQAV